jgi:dihydrofolate reductase
VNEGVSHPSVRHFQAIAAMSLNRVIGHGLKIPWHLPEDFKWFKKMTVGQVVVMGRKTFASIGRPLPHRETIIVSRTGYTVEGVRTVGSLDELDPSRETRVMFICGGAEIYAAALPRCSDLYMTHVKRVVDGDVYFPPFEDQFEPVEVIQENNDFQIVHYRNRQA